MISEELWKYMYNSVYAIYLPPDSLIDKVVLNNNGNKKEFDTNIMFIAEVENSEILSDVPSVTYAYYQKNIKPVERPKEHKVGFVCKICGYIYEGWELPPDFICPLCKHGAEDFEPLQN